MAPSGGLWLEVAGGLRHIEKPNSRLDIRVPGPIPAGLEC